MKIQFGYGGTVPLADGHRCDFSLYEGRLFVTLNADVWYDDNPLALTAKERRFFRWELVLGRKFSRRVIDKKFRRMIDEINGDLIVLGIDDEIKLKTP